MGISLHYHHYLTKNSSCILILFHFNPFPSIYLTSSGPKSMAGAALKCGTHSILFLWVGRRIFIPLFFHDPPAVFSPGGGAVQCIGQDATVSAAFWLGGTLKAEVRPLPMACNRPWPRPSTIRVWVMACICLVLRVLCHIGKGRTLFVAFRPQK